MADFSSVRESGLLRQLVDQGRLVDFEQLPGREIDGPGIEAVLEHPLLPFVSYPYEWGFFHLKKAALLQLDIYLEALAHDATLTDASAYNVQFVGSEPVFIDHLSFRPYRDGEFWVAHRQFCEQFLNPLLLRSRLGVCHNDWYRGSLEGIPTVDLDKVLPWSRKLSWNLFSQVTLQARFQTRSVNRSEKNRSVSLGAGLPRKAFENLLLSLRHWIESLEPRGSDKSVWGDYSDDNSYTSEAATRKRRIIQEFTARTRPRLLWDIGCNTGEYSVAALEAGADYVVGFDADQLAVDRAFHRSGRESRRFLPLLLDAANPAPDQGWFQSERQGLGRRAKADAVLALALVHHLAIGRNIPLDSLVDWLVSLGEHGVVEFVPKSDPMVQELLRFREDIFDEYETSRFLELLEQRAQIVRSTEMIDSDRLLVEYHRR